MTSMSDITKSSLLGFYSNLTLKRAVLLSLSGVASASVGLLYLQKRRTQEKNPFAVDERTFIQDVDPMQVPSDKRAVLKNEFKPEKIPENIDVIIIGSGVGSLTTAAILAKAGKNVLVLEQHTIAGGCCHTFSMNGFEFDTGIHYVGNVVGKGITANVLSQLGAGEKFWAKMDEYYDEVIFGFNEHRHYKMKEGVEGYCQQLYSYFPEEKAAIDAYLQMCRQSYRSMETMFVLKVLPPFVSRILIKLGLFKFINNYVKFASSTTKDVILSLTKNKELQAVMSYFWGDFGTLPSHSPFAICAAIQQHYIKGGYYPIGGTAMIPYNIIKTINRHGGTVLVKSVVDEITFSDDGKKATGVIVHRRKQTDNKIHIKAKMVVSGAGFFNTCDRLIPEEIAKNVFASYFALSKKPTLSISYIILFLGFDDYTHKLGLPARNFWNYQSNDYEEIYNSYMGEDNPIDAIEKHNVPLMYVSFPSAKDPSWDKRFPGGKSTCVAITLAKYEWFENWEHLKVKKRGVEYGSLKEMFKEKMINNVLKIFPQVKDKIVFTNLSTAVTPNAYLNTTKGEMYGLNHDVNRFSPEVTMSLRCDTNIPNLFMAGQDTFTCGMSSALASGLLCSQRILKRNLLNDLKSLKLK